MHRMFVRLNPIISSMALLLPLTFAYAAFNTGPSSQPVASPIMSPTDFASKVTSLKQQTKNSLAEEAKQLLKPSSMASGSTPSSTPANNDNMQTPSSANAPTSTTSSSQNPSTTGFGGSNTNTSAPASSGSWNIKY